ncbi:neuraminidase-like domain-containing protein [Trinickia mobilis]|uniref:neuraminidase-like domain-containing protein n=1 Tax=Trinickia mobilis TaxID=2816356 RepID=UPI001A8D1BEE|nr:neuraminidase-like domain-containing protein [Trinickia mobilis]
MTTAQSISAQLQEARRDACVAYYLGQVAPANPSLKELVKTPNDLYEYLLIDNQVSCEVSTSKVAQAIASLQQYIGAITLQLEPGYESGVAPKQVERWQTTDSRYPLWAASQQLVQYPENYIEPTLRQGKTKLFEALENTINQGRINRDSVEDAVLTYLNGFEEVANLEVVSAYEDGINQKEDTYYFIGRTRSKPYQYYWRQLDISLRNPTTHVLFPSAWTDWKKIDLPLPDSKNLKTSDTSQITAIQGGVRPVFLNNRLYVGWLNVEARPQKPEVPEGEKDYILQFYIAHKKFDDTWSVPHLLQEEKLKGNTSQPNRLIVTVDLRENDPYLALIAYQKGGKTPLAQCVCDMLLTVVSKPFGEELISALGEDGRVLHPYTNSDYMLESAIPKDNTSPGWSGDAVSAIKLDVQFDGKAFKLTSTNSFTRSIYSDPKLTLNVPEKKLY